MPVILTYGKPYRKILSSRPSWGTQQDPASATTKGRDNYTYLTGLLQILNGLAHVRMFTVSVPFLVRLTEKNYISNG
jgi:hypothetical protein